MTKIYLVAADQTLTVRQKPKVASGNINTVYVNVEFSSHWDGFGKSAVFFRDEKGAKPIEKVLTAGECVVPPEVLVDSGVIFIGIRGVDSNGEVKTSALIKYKIDDGAPEGEGTTVEPTSNVYQQLLTAYGKADEAVALERAERQAEIAVERTRIDLLSNYVTPQMFGAVGDGVTDDTEAIQLTISSIEDGKTLCLPNGKYRLSKQIEITKNLSIVSATSELIGKGLKVIGAQVSINGVIFRDILENAIETEENAKLIVDKCQFENIGILDTLDSRYQGCAIYAGEQSNVESYDTVFIECHGHGAIFCNGGGTLNVKNSRFIANYYRAIHIYGENETKGAIFGNHIEDCGKYNNTGSGVGCNGIYSTNGLGIIVENNTILNSRENAIEGVFLKVVGNYIDGTGVEVETKPTPSIEGIFVLPSHPAYIANNIILNAGGFGIKSYKDTAITEPVFIVGNIIRKCGLGAIDINSPVSVSNLHVVDNVVDADVNLNNCNDTDIFIGDISKLNGKPNVSQNNAILDYHHYFDVLNPFTSSNCEPEIKTDSNGESYVEVAYKEYAKLIYAFPSLKNTKHILNFTVSGKGIFSVNITKNNAYYQSVLQIESDEFTEKHFVMPLNGGISDKFKVSIEFEATSCIKFVDIQIYR